MTDYSNLISWLRISAAGSLDPQVGQAADAIEAQAKRIAELEKRINSLEQEEQEWLYTQLEERNRREAELRAALKPFADMAKDAEWFDPYDGFEVAATHCLAARKVLGEK